MPAYVRTDQCDDCRGQGITARMYICPHDQRSISIRPLSSLILG